MLDILSCQKLFFSCLSKRGMCVFFWFYSSLSSRTCSCRDARNRPSTPLYLWVTIGNELGKSFGNGQTQMIFDFALVDDTISIDFVSGICWLFLYRHGRPCRSFHLVLWELFSFVTLLLLG
jgi:hypothetical protein